MFLKDLDKTWNNLVSAVNQVTNNKKSENE